ncbi:MAG TPA: hypothetical protein VIO16_09180 [Dehalococcoidia bacterium]
MAKTVMTADAEAASLHMLFNSEDRTIERLAASVRATLAQLERTRREPAHRRPPTHTTEDDTP